MFYFLDKNINLMMDIIVNLKILKIIYLCTLLFGLILKIIICVNPQN